MQSDIKQKTTSNVPTCHLWAHPKKIRTRWILWSPILSRAYHFTRTHRHFELVNSIVQGSPGGPSLRQFFLCPTLPPRGQVCGRLRIHIGLQNNKIVLERTIINWVEELERSMTAKSCCVTWLQLCNYCNLVIAFSWREPLQNTNTTQTLQ